MGLVYSWCAIVIANGITKPFSDPKEYFMEQFNEFFVILLIYHLICFADFVKDYETQQYVGWSMIATLLINIIINLSIILWDTVVNVYKALRFKWYEKKRDRLLAKLKKDDDLREQIRQDYLACGADLSEI